MDFYLLWHEARLLNISDVAFLRDFLYRSDASSCTFFSGNQEELVTLSKHLLEIPIKELVEVIDCPETYTVSDIAQFSNFEHAIFDVNIIISMDGPLSFSMIGEKLIHAKLDGACKKYGENHAKTASMFNLVSLDKCTNYIVSNTSFGKFSVSLNKEDKMNILKRIALRNPFIKTIIYNAKKGNADYSELTNSLLSKSTSLRRKTNVKKIVTFVLENTEVSYLLNNIVW